MLPDLYVLAVVSRCARVPSVEQEVTSWLNASSRACPKREADRREWCGGGW